MDDDRDCPGHVWVLGEVHVTETGAAMASTCDVCGTVRYEPSEAPLRHRLD